MDFNIQDIFLNNEGNILYSSLRIYRNINNIRFSKYANMQELHYVESSIQNILSNDNFKYIKCEGLKRDELSKLKQSLLIGNKNFNNVSIFTAGNKSIIVNLNEHITIQVVESNLNIKEAYDKAKEEEIRLSKYVSFAFDDNFGFLTSTPKKIGASISISIAFLLPAILSFHKDMLSIFLEDAKQYGFVIKVKNSVVHLRNKHMIGVTEKDILKTAERLSKNIVKVENTLRKRLYKNSSIFIEDRVSRAFAILKNAKILSYKETMKYATLLYLGAELKIIDIEARKIGSVMYMSREFQIREYYGNIEIKKKDIREYRAKIVKEILN